MTSDETHRQGLGSDPSSGPASDAGALRARVGQIEEASAFTDRSVEVLGDEISQLHAKLREAIRRISVLEDRLGRLTDRIDAGGLAQDDDAPDIEFPPHSAGPDVPRDYR
ncbi:MAG: hypothetical protein AAF995_09410 [Planctomycetota bacterium]